MVALSYERNAKTGSDHGELADLTSIRSRAVGQNATTLTTADRNRLLDIPARLRVYGEDRRIVLSPSDRLFRTKGALAPLEDYFQLGVSFGATLINRHRIELFLLDQKGQVAEAFTRLHVEEVLAHAARLAKRA